MSPRLYLLFEQLPGLLGGHLTLAVPAIFFGSEAQYHIVLQAFLPLLERKSLPVSSEN